MAVFSFSPPKESLLPSASKAQGSSVVIVLKVLLGASLLAGISYAGYKYIKNKQVA
jgi:hypothetical protein